MGEGSRIRITSRIDYSRCEVACIVQFGGERNSVALKCASASRRGLCQSVNQDVRAVWCVPQFRQAALSVMTIGRAANRLRCANRPDPGVRRDR